MQWAKKIIFLILLTSFFVAVPTVLSPQEVYADRADTLKEKLVALRRKIEKGALRFDKLGAQREEIASKQAALNKEYDSAISRQNALRETAESLGEEAERLKLLVYGARIQMEQQRARLHKRLVALYKAKRRAPHADYLFQSRSATDLLKRAKYLASIAANDRQYIDRLMLMVKQGQDDRERLERLLSSRRAKLIELVEIKANLEANKLQQAILLEDAETKQKQERLLIAKLKKDADGIEAALEKLIDRSTQEADRENAEVFEGKGLAKLRGSLIFPVRGRLLEGFGRKQHEQFSDVLIKKGLEVQTSEEEEVYAIADAKVIYTQILPGFGRVAILDHGKRFYSLYGRLGSFKCNTGDRVFRGQKIALAGETSGDEANFYFELRIQGKARNPAAYFADLPSK